MENAKVKSISNYFTKHQSINFDQIACNCDSNGSSSQQCDSHGNCICNKGYSTYEFPFRFANTPTQKCDKCASGYFGFPVCIGIIIVLKRKSKFCTYPEKF